MARESGGGSWFLWLAMFLLVEIPAAVLKNGATLSENVWAWFSIKERRRLWLARRLVLATFLGVLGAHFLTGGVYQVTGGLAVGATAAPVVVVIVLSLIFERKEDPNMGGLLTKLAKPLIVKFLKGNWGKLIPMVFKAIADGEFGKVPQRAYIWLAGKKTISGAALFGLALAFEGVCSNYPSITWSCGVSRVLYDLGAVLLAVGLIDGGVRSPWPESTRDAYVDKAAETPGA
jgi:hypothetical protein